MPSLQEIDQKDSTIYCKRRAFSVREVFGKVHPQVTVRIVNRDGGMV
jgi:hypothetical protein